MIKKFFKYFIVSIVCFLSFNLSLMAYHVGGSFTPHSCSAKGSESDLCKTKYWTPGVGYERNFGAIGVLEVDGNFAYCVEPGKKISGGYDANWSTLNDYRRGYFENSDDIYKKTLLRQAMTYSPDFKTRSRGSLSDEELYNVYAAQGILWEIASGERDSFAHFNPDYSKNYKFYDALGKNYTTKRIRNYYHSIVQKAWDAYYAPIGDQNGYFSRTRANAQIVPLTCYGKKCSITISSSLFYLWYRRDVDGLDTQFTNTDLTISTTDVIPYNNPRTITLGINGNIGTPYVYFEKDTSHNRQDVMTPGGVDQEIYLKVYTPKYQMHIKKQSKSDLNILNQIPLKGAKFNICSDNKCSNIITTITTDSNGDAYYKGLDKPGTYYIKEIKAPSGYEINNSIYAVEVGTNDVEGTNNYGSKTIYNNSKIFNLTKNTIDENGYLTVLDDGCGEDKYTGPEFEIKEKGVPLNFLEIEKGVYIPSTKTDKKSVTKLKTCNGKFKVYNLENCNYTISETKAPEGLILPSEPTKKINVCSSDKNISFTNGFSGLEFHKKNDDGEYIDGGKFSLQQKKNNLYKDILLEERNKGFYSYNSKLNEDSIGATYILETSSKTDIDTGGKILIEKLPPGEYRIVEKEAPEGYELIKDKDSTAVVTIKDSDKSGYYLVELVNHKVNKYGSSDQAELIVTITTGRKVYNYFIIISGLVIALVLLILIRKRIKK